MTANVCSPEAVQAVSDAAKFGIWTGVFVALLCSGFVSFLWALYREFHAVRRWNRVRRRREVRHA